MIKLFKILFFNSMIIGTIIAISSFSWLSAWIGLEINLLSLIPLLKNHKNKFSTESTLKYFITQVMASSILLLSVVISLSSKIIFMNQPNSIESLILCSALLLKMGAAPFHFWFPEVLSGLNWTNSFIMLTWQKIAPLILISYQIKMYQSFFSVIIIISSLISGIQGLNQICLRKILAYSSINHIGWMMSALLNSTNVCVCYFLIYCLMNMNIILIMKKYNVYYLNQLTNIFNNKNIKFLFMMNFLSLGGLPPFLGFFPKWLTVNNMINNNHYFLSTLLIIFTLMVLYFYLRITFSTFTIYFNKSLTMNLNKISFFHFLTNSLSLMGLFVCSLLSSFM